MLRYGKSAAAICFVVALSVPLPSVAAGDVPMRKDATGMREAPIRMVEARGNTLSGIAVDGLPTRIRGLGTFVGGIAVIRDRGNGNYFAIDGNLGGPAGIIDTRAAKIVRVTPEAASAACAIEHGVCVIRP